MNLLLMRARCFPVHGRPMQRSSMFPVSACEDDRAPAETPDGNDGKAAPKRGAPRQLGFSRLKTWAFSS
jgi:hypothetical protein